MNTSETIWQHHGSNIKSKHRLRLDHLHSVPRFRRNDNLNSSLSGKYVFYPNAGDCPERILHATVEIRDDWLRWTASEPDLVIEPQESYEGAALPLKPSVRGLAPEPVRELRDPAIFQEDGQAYLLYSVAGEQGIAIGRISGF